MTGLLVAAVVWLVAAVIAGTGFGFAVRATRRARMYAAGAEEWRQALAATEPGDDLTALADAVREPEPTYRDEPVVRPYMLGGWGHGRYVQGAPWVQRGAAGPGIDLLVLLAAAGRDRGGEVTTTADHWLNRAPAMLREAGRCSHGEPDATTVDRRWLWRLELYLAVSGTTPAQRQMRSDLRQYLGQTCEHHWHAYPAEAGIDALRQCLYCNDVEWGDLSSSHREEAGAVASGTAVPAPTVCLPCGGDGVIVVEGQGQHIVRTWCGACRCGVCGQPTDTPPECGECAVREDAMQVRREDRP